MSGVYLYRFTGMLLCAALEDAFRVAGNNLRVLHKLHVYLARYARVLAKVFTDLGLQLTRPISFYKAVG